MLNNIIEFNEGIEIKNKDYSIYKDENRMFPFNTIQALARVEYMELSKEEYEKAKFEMKIDKDLEYNIIDTKRPQSKYQETKKQEDMWTIIESTVSVRQVWNVTNGLGMFKSFSNKEEAFKLANEINEKIFNAIL